MPSGADGERRSTYFQDAWAIAGDGTAADVDGVGLTASFMYPFFVALTADGGGLLSVGDDGVVRLLDLAREALQSGRARDKLHEFVGATQALAAA